MMLLLLLRLQKQKRSEVPSMMLLDDAQDTAVVDLLRLVQGRRNSSVGRPLRWKVKVATSMIELEEEAELMTQQWRRRSGIFSSSLSYIDDWPPPPSSSSSYP
jgi:hypothetical protein